MAMIPIAAKAGRSVSLWLGASMELMLRPQVETFMRSPYEFPKDRPPSVPVV